MARGRFDHPVDPGQEVRRVGGRAAQARRPPTRDGWSSRTGRCPGSMDGRPAERPVGTSRIARVPGVGAGPAGVERRSPTTRRCTGAEGGRPAPATWPPGEPAAAATRQRDRVTGRARPTNPTSGPSPWCPREGRPRSRPRRASRACRRRRGSVRIGPRRDAKLVIASVLRASRQLEAEVQQPVPHGGGRLVVAEADDLVVVHLAERRPREASW